MKNKLVALYLISGILIFVFVFNNYLTSDSDIDYTEKLTVKKSYKLPSKLEEISGISHINDSTLACIQDEKGTIYIYDLMNERVSKEILFGPRRDYEAIRVIDSTAYVIESGGRIFKINNFNSEKFKVEIFDTEFDRRNDMESLEFNEQNNEFLTIPKEINLSAEDEDFIIYRIGQDFKVKDQRFARIKSDDSTRTSEKSLFGENRFKPSELAIHPHSTDIYILDSKMPRLLILNPEGKFKDLYVLNPEQFQQPEGLSFDSKGNMYISNEKNNYIDQNIQAVEWK